MWLILPMLRSRLSPKPSNRPSPAVHQSANRPRHTRALSQLSVASTITLVISHRTRPVTGPRRHAMPSGEQCKSNMSHLSRKLREGITRWTNLRHRAVGTSRERPLRRGLRLSPQVPEPPRGRQSILTSRCQVISLDLPRTMPHLPAHTPPPLRFRMHDLRRAARWPRSVPAACLRAALMDSQWLRRSLQRTPRVAWRSPRAGSSHFHRTRPRHQARPSGVPVPSSCPQPSMPLLDKNPRRATSDRARFLALVRSFSGGPVHYWVVVDRRMPRPVLDRTSGILLSV